MNLSELSFDIFNLRKLLLSSELQLDALYDEVYRRIELDPENPVWISVLDRSEVDNYLSELKDSDPTAKPLYGIPFAIKDNIDLAGVPTTAGCPAYKYLPEESAFVCDLLIKAGAVPIGKTNMDQFATGLVGVRSPYGATQNSFNPEYISGGSSSGSAVAVSSGMVSFSLGTDTAGSGRVPASLNNIIGLKPSLGILSTDGVVPACRTLDCVSVFSHCASDAEVILSVLAKPDPDDPYSRDDSGMLSVNAESFKFAVLDQESREFFGNEEGAHLYEKAIETMCSLGGKPVSISYDLFNETALLLYEGPWVAERYAAVGSFIESNKEEVYPVTADIILGGAKYEAADAFKSFYKLQKKRKLASRIFDDIDFLLLPTNALTPKIDDVLQDPIALNSKLGHYTNYMNLLDLCGLAVPFSFYENGMPFGVTLAAPAFNDRSLLQIAKQFEKKSKAGMGKNKEPVPESTEVNIDKSDRITLAVCGAHMSGLPLNYQLTDLSASLIKADQTSPNYELFVLKHKDPIRPGLLRVESGSSIGVELWSLPIDNFGAFIENVQAPLGIGSIELAEGSWVKGFVCEQYACADAENISSYGNWRDYMVSVKF